MRHEGSDYALSTGNLWAASRRVAAVSFAWLDSEPEATNSTYDSSFEEALYH